MKLTTWPLSCNSGEEMKAQAPTLSPAHPAGEPVTAGIDLEPPSPFTEPACG